MKILKVLGSNKKVPRSTPANHSKLQHVHVNTKIPPIIARRHVLPGPRVKQ